MRLQWIQSIVHPCTTKDSELVRVRGNDLPCIFPFKINGRRYDGCTSDDEVMPWCSVQTDDEGNHVPSDEENGKTWGYCDIKKCFKASQIFVPKLFHPIPETDKTCDRERVCLQHDECPELLEISREEQRPLFRANGCNKKERGYCCPQGKYFMCYRYEMREEMLKTNFSFEVIAGSWSAWTTCDGGTKRRLCNNPEPSGGGADCAGMREMNCIPAKYSPSAFASLTTPTTTPRTTTTSVTSTPRARTTTKGQFIQKHIE